jgi:glycosyltransferase Alg8
MIKHPLATITPKVLKYNSLVTFVLVLMFSHGVLNLPKLNAFTSDKKEKKEERKKEFLSIPKDKKVAPFINKLIKNSKEKKLTINLPSKSFHIYEPIIIDRSRVKIIGNDTKIISHIKKPHIAALQAKGERRQKIGVLSESLTKGDTILNVSLKKGAKISKYLLLREPNTKEFLESIKSEIWDKKYPYLREQIVKVSKYDLEKGVIYISKPITLDLNSKKTEVYALKMVEKVEIKGLVIKQVIPDEDIKEYAGIYKNLQPDYAVDLVRFDYSANSSIKETKLFSAGRHPLVFENGYELKADNLHIDGSFNKGKKANGYFRIARTYFSDIKNLTIKNIRHLTLQWSSAKNYIHDINMEVDLNLHGGFTHDNKIENITFNIPPTHKWKPITKTPTDAKWAPPDGVNFIDEKSISIK